MRTRRQLRAELIRKSGGVCALCGTADPFLHIEHIIPTARGGTSEPSNLMAVCAQCNTGIGQRVLPRETEFIDYLSRLLAAHPDFSDVRREVVTGTEDVRYRLDITAVHKTPSKSRNLIIECKSLPALSGPRLDSALEQLNIYSQFNRGSTLVLAFPGRASEDDKKALKQKSVEIWDIDYIAQNFRREVEAVDHPYFQALFEPPTPELSSQEKLLLELKDCPPGKPQALTYQRLIGRILEAIFCPPLTPPLSESGDLTGTNRRDFVLPNYADSGFWNFMRSRYFADYIVVDAKNYTDRVKKKDILQISNYLKPQGTGLFGMIFSRNGPDKNASLVIREQWLLHNKLILVLADRDVESMLLAHSSQGDPTTILSDRIQEFRLSI